MDKPSLNNIKLAQVLIVVVAAFTLFWQYPQLQFTHDELSALYKTELPTFSELIEKGVKVEGHPAGVEVFLYYYAPLVNYELWALKLPFSLMALASILIIFAIGRVIDQEAAALYTGAIMAVSQYFIYYGQIVRPYEVGLFFSLLSALFWMRYFYRSPDFKNIFGFAIAAAGAAYSHQFSLLLVGLMGLHALIIAKGRSKIAWLIGGLLTFVLYLPHLNIFLHQLSLGGVGSWLAKPEFSFPISYLAYIFHFSFLFISAFTLAFFWRKGKLKKGKNWEGLIWFGSSLLIGFFYSRQINPVLQYSTLVFAAPLLLLSLFALRQIRMQWLSLLLIMGTGLYSLYAERKHYPLGYESPFKYPREYAAKRNLSERSLILNIDQGKWAFYARLDQYASEENYFYTQPLHLQQYVENSSLDEIVLSLDHTGAHFIPEIIIQAGYDQINKEDHLGFSLFHFSKKLKASPLIPLDEVETTLIPCKAEKNYFGNMTLKLADQDLESEDYLLAHFELTAVPTKSEAQLIIAFFAGDNLVQWSNRPISQFQSKSSFSAWHSQILPKNWEKYPEIEVRAMLESKGELIFIEKASLSLRKGNNRIYGINQAFD